MRMTQKRKTIKAAIERFDEAAQSWGWQLDQGCGDKVNQSEAEYKAAKADLERLVLGA